MRFAWRCLTAVPHLHVQPGDVLVYEPSDRRHPYTVVRTVDVDPGAIMGAEFAGQIEALHPIEHHDAGEPCRVLPFPARQAAQVPVCRPVQGPPASR